MASRASRTLEFSVVADIQDLQKKLNQAAKQTEDWTKKFDKVGTTLSRNVSLPLAGLGVVATKAASDLGESINAINVVFGEAADTIHEFGKTSAETVGLSTRAFNDLVVPLGSVFQNFGDSADEAARKSIELTQRAADMASVFNVDVTEALTAIQAALRGEADPIERFGVSVNAAAVEAKALALGLAETKSQITDADKATARYALILEQTARVAGDFTNTSDQLANKTRILKADAENLAAEFGEALLPIMASVVDVAGDAAEAFGNLSPEAQETVVQLALVAAAAGPALKGLGALGKAAAAVATSIKALNLLVAGAGGLVPALKALGAAAAPVSAIAGVFLAVDAAGNKLGNSLSQKLTPELGELNLSITDLANPGRWSNLIADIRDYLTVTEVAATSTGRYRNQVERQIFMTRLQAQEQEELNRVFSRFRSTSIPPPDVSEYERRISRAIDTTRNLAREQLALVDPVLARALAEQRAADAQDRYAEVVGDAEASERDRERAALDLLTAEAELDALTKDLADSISGPLVAAFDALLARTGLARDDFQFLIDDLREFNSLANGFVLTGSGRQIPVRDLNRELVRHGQQVVE